MSTSLRKEIDQGRKRAEYQANSIFMCDWNLLLASLGQEDEVTAIIPAVFLLQGKRSVWVGSLGAFVCGLAGFAQVVLPEEKVSGRPIFLWTVQSETSKSYLLGSLHMAPKTMYPLPRAMEEAFFACDSLVVEMDPTALPAGQLAEMILSHAVHPARISYKDELNEATFQSCRTYWTNMG